MSANIITNIRIGDLSNLLTLFYRKVARSTTQLKKNQEHSEDELFERLDIFMLFFMIRQNCIIMLSMSNLP